MNDQVQFQIVIGVLASYGLEWLKRMSWFPVLTEQSTKIVKQLFSVVVAAFSALAITYSFDPTLGRLTIDGLTLTNVGHGFLTFVWSLIAQHGTHTLLIKPTKEV